MFALLYDLLMILPLLVIAIAVLLWLALSHAWRVTGSEQEAAMLNDVLQDIEEKNPDWDRAARFTSCQRALKQGLSRKTLVTTYGEAMVAEAENQP